MIPEQLQRTDILVVLLPPREKGVHTPGWNLVENGVKPYDPRLSHHVKAGGNLGFYPGPSSSLLILDVDIADTFHQAGGDQLVEGTYRYSAWQDRKKYRALLECQDIPVRWHGYKTSIKGHGAGNNDPAALEIFFPAGPVSKLIEETRPDGTRVKKQVTITRTGGQVVAPYATHPNGNQYLPFDESAPIKPVSWDQVVEVCERIRPAALEQQQPKDAPVCREYAPPGRRLLRERYNLMLEMPDDPRPSGEEIRGSNPWHGSTSPGGNVAVNPGKGVFFCFRHMKGYDAAGVDAIRRGIISCGDDYDGPAFKRHVEELERDYPEVRALEKEAWKRQKKAEREGNR